MKLVFIFVIGMDWEYGCYLSIKNNSFYLDNVSVAILEDAEVMPLIFFSVWERVFVMWGWLIQFHFDRKDPKGWKVKSPNKDECVELMSSENHISWKVDDFEFFPINLFPFKQIRLAYFLDWIKWKVFGAWLLQNKDLQMYRWYNWTSLLKNIRNKSS